MDAGSRTFALLALALALACAAGPSPVASPPAQPPSTQMLASGPFRVGFRAAWTFDASRPYRTAFDNGATYGGAAGAPRPILVNVWYPADGGGAATNRAAYLQPPGGPEVGALAIALATYERKVIAEEVFGDDEPKLSPELGRRFGEYLAAPMLAVRDAPPAPGRFPVLLYHAGMGSSFEDSAELCEQLASHGYVVLGSSFLRADGTSFNVGDGPRDFDVLIAWAADHLSFADPARVGGFGHSGGAGFMLEYAAGTTGAPRRIHAFAMLDTTFDYHGIARPLHTSVPELLEHRRAVSAPLLVVAKPHAMFALIDQLDGADRTLLTIRGLDHEDFVGHGVSRSFVRANAAERGPRVLAAYRAMTDAVRAYFDRELRDDRAAAQRLAALAASPLNGAAPRIETMARGARRPAPYDESTGRPPTPHQLRYVLEDRGGAATVALLRDRRAADPENPIYTGDSELACSLLYELFSNDRRDDAIAVYGYFRELHPGLVDDLVDWAKLALMLHKPNVAKGYVATALLLVPDHPKARAFAQQTP